MNSEDEENDDNKGCIEFAHNVIRWKNIIQFMTEHDRYDENICREYINAVWQFLYEFATWKKIRFRKNVGSALYELL